MSHPLAASSVSWRAVSIPSPTVRRPSAAAIPVIASSNARARGCESNPATNPRSIFKTSSGKRLR